MKVAICVLSILILSSCGGSSSKDPAPVINDVVSENNDNQSVAPAVENAADIELSQPNILLIT